MQKYLVKLPNSAQKLLMRVSSFIQLFCFDFQFCVNVRLHKLGCRCMTVILTVTETRLKDPQIKAKQKVVQNSLPFEVFST